MKLGLFVLEGNAGHEGLNVRTTFRSTAVQRRSTRTNPQFLGNACRGSRGVTAMREMSSSPRVAMIGDEIMMSGGAVGATPELLDDVQRLTIEAFADTIVPGVKRFPGDRAIAGVCDEAGAVEAGALELLADPATGVTEGVPHLAVTLNEHAIRFAERSGIDLGPDVPPFVALEYDQRAALVAELTAPGHPEKDGWVLLALFCNMAFDIAAHRHTGEAIAEGHPGLLQMGFAEPDSDGLWRFPDFGYGREMAERHPGTTSSGSPS